MPGNVLEAGVSETKMQSPSTRETEEQRTVKHGVKGVGIEFGAGS